MLSIASPILGLKHHRRVRAGGAHAPALVLTVTLFTMIAPTASKSNRYRRIYTVGYPKRKLLPKFVLIAIECRSRRRDLRELTGIRH